MMTLWMSTWKGNGCITSAPGNALDLVVGRAKAGKRGGVHRRVKAVSLSLISIS
jgi:hypothetical protein